MEIKPINLPTGAGLTYGDGDVRHFSQGDAMSVPAIANPTRQLAERDNLIVEKVNEVIATVNNREQFVPLPILRTILPKNTETVVTNYRIPAGFEARVLNASIASTPVSEDIELTVMFNDSFGGSTGTELVSTSNEYTGSGSFSPPGEFIISINNRSALTLEIMASVLLTVRPIDSTAAVLTGAVITGPAGPPGAKGPPGPAGPPGTGGAGSPGMVWKGAWTDGAGYASNDVVSFLYNGTAASSFISRTPHTASALNSPQVDAVTWNTVALGGGPGGVGPQGPAGGEPTLTSNVLNGTFITGADYVGGADYGDYTGGGAPSTTYANLAITQYAVTTPSGTLAFVDTSFRRTFKGHGTIRLPQMVDGAYVDYTNSNIQLTVVDNGTNVTGSGTHSVSCERVSSPVTDYVVRVFNEDPVKVALHVSGIQQG